MTKETLSTAVETAHFELQRKLSKTNYKLVCELIDREMELDTLYYNLSTNN